MLAVGCAIQRSSLLTNTTISRSRYRPYWRNDNASYFRTVIKRFITRLGNQKTDMPGGPRNTRAKPSSESQEDISQPSRGSVKKITTDKKKTSKAPETGQKNAAPAPLKPKTQLQRKLLSSKDEIVETLMAVFKACLDKQLESYEGPCDGEACSGSSSHGHSHRPSGKSTTHASKQTLGKKRQLQRDEHSGGEDEDADGGRRRPGQNKRIKSEPAVRYMACPYSKYAPERYKKESVCCGPGFTKFHRLKEHVERKHGLPEFPCVRCCETFKNKAELHTHSRAAKACAVRNPSAKLWKLEDGFDQEQLKEIKKRSKRNSPDHDKWIHLYCILFKVPTHDVPSPYQGDDSPDWRNGHTDRAKHAAYVDYMREEMPPRMRVLIEEAATRMIQKAMPDAWNVVRSGIPDLWKSVQRVWESDQSRHGINPSTGLDFVQGVSDSVPNMPDIPAFPDLSQFEFSPEDGFDFDQIDAPMPLPYSSDFSDTSVPTSLSGGTMSSSSASNTSLEDHCLVQDPYKLGDLAHNTTQAYDPVQLQGYGLQEGLGEYTYL